MFAAEIGAAILILAVINLIIGVRYGLEYDDVFNWAWKGRRISAGKKQGMALGYVFTLAVLAIVVVHRITR